MKPFEFQQFSVLQDKSVFRVGTDGVLLGALASCHGAKKILEVGTGTGMISLMIAQRNPVAKILALDIDPRAVELAQQNFENSSFKERLNAENQDFKKFISETKYDLIISNPPYFEPMKNSEKDILARQQIELDFEQLIKNSAKNLSEKGIFSVIIPKESEAEFVNLAKENNLHLYRKVEIQGNENTDVKRCVLEFSFVQNQIKMEKLVLEVSPRCYSPQYLELTKEFHRFGGS